jgi:hypothetical protein
MLSSFLMLNGGIMAKNVNVIGAAKIYQRQETPTMGIRITTHLRGMFAKVD